MSNTLSQTREIKFEIPDYDGIGVYSIINEQTGKRYIGSSKNVAKRLYQHLISFRTGKCNEKFQEDIINGHTFKTEILEKLPYGINQFDMFGKESFYIAKYNCIEQGYNLAPTTASSKEELLKSLKSFEKSEVMRKYILGIIKKRERPMLPPEPKMKKVTNERYLEKLDDIKVRVPKGRKAEIQACADANGESLNDFIVKAVDERIKALKGK